MWEGMQALIALAAIVGVTVVAVVVLEELTDVPDRIRSGIRGRVRRRSLATRVDELEERMVVAERKLGRPAA